MPGKNSYDILGLYLLAITEGRPFKNESPVESLSSGSAAQLSRNQVFISLSITKRLHESVEMHALKLIITSERIFLDHLFEDR
ncbi:hypothetical protein DSL72_004041 [Monilinia vaccinii-corymbosi]|uniref:Uncharacterized protein n=1 Tax=Monilinia vaccinii-corymbosi TaxID=61207 RepID=A0A8A3P9K1_9HELO|nr:hypothetical protein DSL72_004041 [Monilinia vaccinii-corymbosi]